MHPMHTQAGQARYAELNQMTKNRLVAMKINPVPGVHCLTPASQLAKWKKHELITEIMRAEDDYAAEQAGYTNDLGEKIGQGIDLWGFGVVTQATINTEQPGAMTVTNETGKRCDVYADQKYRIRKAN